jgi:hypothetical protein
MVDSADQVDNEEEDDKQIEEKGHKLVEAESIEDIFLFRILFFTHMPHIYYNY